VSKIMDMQILVDHGWKRQLGTSSHNLLQLDTTNVHVQRRRGLLRLRGAQ